jgi:hypothetical protein
MSTWEWGMLTIPTMTRLRAQRFIEIEGKIHKMGQAGRILPGLFWETIETIE